MTHYVARTTCYNQRVIRSFKCKDTEKLWNRERVARFGSIARVGLNKLMLLDAATSKEELRLPPGNRLEELKGNREGQSSVRINDQFRVCFVWRDGDALDVEIVDYH